MGFASESKKVLRNRFISGLLVIVPLILTFVLLRVFVESVDGLLRPLVIKILGRTYDFPLVGVIVTFVIIVLAGIFTANVVGARFVKLWERFLLKIPIINFLYGSAKQLVEALTIPQKKTFKSVVIVEYPRRGVYVLGFLVNRIVMVKSGEGKQISDDTNKSSGDERSSNYNLLSVFIPSTPTPISGFVVLFPEKEVVHLSMTIEEGIKFFVSGSIISPEYFYPKYYGIPQNSEDKKKKIILEVDTTDETE
jgi:uncharacterized membrane protein